MIGHCVTSRLPWEAVGNGYPREDGFDIVVASEIMAIFCLAKDLDDLKQRIGKIVVAYTRDKQPICASDLKAEGAPHSHTQGCVSTQPRADSGGNAGVCARRTLRQYCPWLQQRYCNPGWFAPRGLCGDRGRLWC